MTEKSFHKTKIAPIDSYTKVCFIIK